MVTVFFKESSRNNLWNCQFFRQKMLCVISEASGSFFATWAWMSVLETFFLFITSAPVFYYYYWNTNVTFEKWIYKSNPKFPSPEKVSIAYFPVLNGTMTTTIFTGAR